MFRPAYEINVSGRIVSSEPSFHFRAAGSGLASIFREPNAEHFMRLFEATPVIFATLIDDKPDKNGHMSRLIITKQDKEQLLQRIQTAFGEKLKQGHRNYIVGSAIVLRDMLQKKGYHCSDEPD
jgi:hypothetical protein